MSSSIYCPKLILALQLILTSVLTNVASTYLYESGLMNALVIGDIDAVVGEQIFLQVLQPVNRQTKCTYRINNDKEVDITKPHKPNIEAMSGEICGLTIKNISKEENGFIRLTSTNENEIARGIAFIKVRSDVQPMTKRIESVAEKISPEKTTYCYVLRPHESKTAFPQHENCDFPELVPDTKINGIWQVVSGVKGRTQEVSFEVNVEPIVEELQTFVEHDRKTSELRMKCTLLHSRRKIIFCRFLRLGDDVGFNIQQGSGGDRYRYFGAGFKSLECGVSINNPDEIDKSPWKCFLGVEDTDGELHTVGAIVDATDPQQTARGDIESNDVFGLEHTTVNILCKRYIPTDYCWFRDPSGQKISVSDQKIIDPLHIPQYSYFGTGIKLGECGLSILEASHNHSGTWTCHMGASHVAGVDSVKEISVRITESPFVATNLFQDAQQSHSLLLECRSIPEHLPLEYCRFVLPDGTGFSINENSTSKNLHMNNYYFNPNRHMKSGYCSIIVKQVVRSHHQGQWTCATRIIGDEEESSDEFRVTVFESSISTASTSGMLFAIVLIISGLLFITYQRYRKAYSPRRTTQMTQPTIVSYVANAENVSISSRGSSSYSQNQGIELQTMN